MRIDEMSGNVSKGSVRVERNGGLTRDDMK